ncbi:spondin-1-like [Patiria miniata]|uniref:Pleiotrophin/Midkine C-terminal domain-containing protein n=1 Tax=Patiria miniata TaxID=46514 RepID=A0A913ZH69_PATMI|nr:spondin-1-like [Patiria miniata]
MRKLLLLLMVLAICVAMVTAGKKDRERKDRRREGKKARPQADAAQPENPPTEDSRAPKHEQTPTQQPSNQPQASADSQRPSPADDRPNPRCSEWRWSACEVRHGRPCGKGVERATRDGENCKKKEQVRPCRVPCEAQDQGTARTEGEGRRKGGNNGEGRDRGASSQEGEERQRVPPKRQREETPPAPEENTEKCKYNKKDWTACDEQTSLQTRLYILKKGDPATCPAKKVITKPCDKYQRRLENKNNCEYVLGPWSLCNVTSDMRERHDTLIDQTKESVGCRLVRDIHQRCAVACVYGWGEWSDCDEEAGKRSITGTLVRENITPADCQETIARTKPCYGKNGTEKCFFGPWSGYGTCVNGFKLRTRKLLVGGRRCELRASHAIPCKG